MFESLSKKDAQINYKMGLICEGTTNNGRAATRLCWLSKMPKKYDVNDEFPTVYDDVLLTYSRKEVAPSIFLLVTPHQTSDVSSTCRTS
jgi:hypothetical protein